MWVAKVKYFRRQFDENMSVENNYKNEGAGMDIWGKQRLELGLIVRDKVLSKLNIPWVIENGTLLGAYRDGKFIVHDDDFDIALFFESSPEAPELLERIRQLLPKPYEARYVSTYSQKIEVYDPTHGSFVLGGPQYKGANFHFVTTDLQFYQRFNSIYRCLYFGIKKTIEIPAEAVFPLKSTMLEGHEFQAPSDVEAYLKCWYGSLSPNAKFNPDTGFYEENVWNL